MPHRSILDVSDPPPKPTRIISPSLSSASAVDEEEWVEQKETSYKRPRDALSPSPEVDLSSPELDQDCHHGEPPTPGAPFSGRTSLSRQRSGSSASNLARNHRGASPQLEHEERDFKQTANALYEQAQRRRSSSQDVDMQYTVDDDDTTAGAQRPRTSTDAPVFSEDSEEALARRNREAAAVLFGHTDQHPKPFGHLEFSSPLMAPKATLSTSFAIAAVAAPGDRPRHPSISLSLPAARTEGVEPMILDAAVVAVSASAQRGDGVGSSDWDTLQSPEQVAMDELEDMFDAY